MGGQKEGISSQATCAFSVTQEPGGHRGGLVGSPDRKVGSRQPWAGEVPGLSHRSAARKQAPRPRRLLAPHAPHPV